MGNKVYVLLIIGLSTLFFIITGVQYWGSDYMITELKQDEGIVFIAYAVISITGPVLGVVVGGTITTKLGGYTTFKAIKFTGISAALCVCSALPIPFVNNFPLFAILLWFLLFFGGAILPAMTGIMINTVSIEQKTTANSLANLFYNLL